jgi:hypothetical protein
MLMRRLKIVSKWREVFIQLKLLSGASPIVQIAVPGWITVDFFNIDYCVDPADVPEGESNVEVNGVVEEECCHSDWCRLM